MKTLELKNVSVTEMTTIESALIDGGDVDGLMRGPGIDISWMGDVYDFAVSFGSGLARGFFS